MKKAVILLVHQLPVQINILLEQLLYDGTTDVFIHVNKLCESIIPEIDTYPNVYYVKKNVAIHWGSDEILQAILNSLQEIVSCGIQYNYVFLCTGQDLIIKGNMDEFIKENYGRIFIDNVPMEREYVNRYMRARYLYRWPTIYRRKYDWKYHPIRLLRSFRTRFFMSRISFLKGLFEKKINIACDNIQFYKDNYHFLIPMEVASYITNFVNNNQEYMKIYKDSYMPEEGFFMTILMASKYRENFDIIGWGEETRTISVRKKEINQHADIYTMDDIPSLEESQCFIARKFDIRVDSDVIEHYRNKICGGALTTLISLPLYSRKEIGRILVCSAERGIVV